MSTARGGGVTRFSSLAPSTRFWMLPVVVIILTNDIIVRYIAQAMPPVIEEFWASTRAQRHMLSRHSATFEEACEAAASTKNYERTSGGPGRERRSIAAGKTSEGRRPVVIFADEGGGRGRIITAREPKGHKERARHKRTRGD